MVGKKPPNWKKKVVSFFSLICPFGILISYFYIIVSCSYTVTKNFFSSLKGTEKLMIEILKTTSKIGVWGKYFGKKSVTRTNQN